MAISDYGKVNLNPNDMVSFKTDSGAECDFTAKPWGFYLASSLNQRLKKEGFKVALVVNGQGKLYLNAVEASKMDLFKEYLAANQNSRVICWLDDWTKE